MTVSPLGGYDSPRMDPSERPSPPEIDVGTVFDRYEILRHVARGGMGSVWLARFTGKHGFTKQVAIKTIVPELAENPQFHAMFLEEARISSKLAHANAAQVLDVGEHGRTVYIVFEWVEGRSIEELCRAAEAKGGKIPLPLILRALADASAGLHAAHILSDESGKELGIVHRDVTPNNILVSDKGFAKVIDFGIAKARDRIAVETRSGFVKGTPQYMSPEAAARLKIDNRSDVWSLRAILFPPLAGTPAIPDHSRLLDYIDGVTKLPPLPDDVPAEVKAIVTRALAVSAGDRFQSAEKMRTALERAIHASDATAADVQKAASELVSLASTPKKGDAAAGTKATGFESTKLAVTPLSTPASRARAAQTPGGTLLSEKAAGPPRAAALAPAKRRDSTRALVFAFVIAVIVTGAAVALAFCG